MATRTWVWGWVGVAAGAGLVSACEGSSWVNDVGDLPGSTSGRGGAGNEGGAGAVAGSGGSAGSKWGGEAGDGAAGAPRGGRGGAGGTVGGTGAQGGTGGKGGVGAEGGLGGRASCEAVGVAPREMAGGQAGDDATGAGGGSLGVCPVGPGYLFASGDDIRAVAADETHVYWVEYGTTDGLRNHRHDGRVRARSYDGGEERTLIEGLDGPIAIELTPQHVYAYLDYGDPTGETASLIRVPLDGGVGEIVLDGALPRLSSDFGLCHQCFATTDDRDYFVVGGDVYSVPTEACLAPELVIEGKQASAIAADETHVYFGVLGNEDWALWRATRDGHAATELSRVHGYAGLGFGLVGSYIYAVEAFEEATDSDWLYPSFLTRAAKDEPSMWTTMASLGNRVGWLRFSGERYVAASASGSVDAIVTGLVSQAPAVTTLSGAALEPNAWRPSPHGVLWLAAGGSEIRFDPFPPGGGSSGGGDLGTYDACAEADECLPPVWFRVTDGDNDAPITDLTVSANGITVECAPDPDNDCWWICQSDRRPLLDGEYVMTVSAPGYHQKIVRFTVQTPAECGCCDCSCTGGYQPGTAVDLYTNGDTLPGCCAATATDPNHCGACGNVCESGHCEAGTCG
jgi:hypothetical protein